MRVCLVQTDIFWEKKEANMASIEEQLTELDSSVDWVILPEMFTTGFSVATDKLAEHLETNTFRWMKQMASRLGAVVSGGFVTKDASGIHNTLLSVSPNGGIIGKYDKHNLFSFGGESELFTAGQKKSLFKVKDFDCLGLICYDLRFPEWSRYGDPEYDVLFYVASWPKPRIEQWRALLRARAIENQCYVVGVNRLGVDGTGLEYNGQSVVFNCKGDLVLDLVDDQRLGVVDFDINELKNYREKIPFLKDIK